MNRRPKLLFFITEDWYFVLHRLPLAVAARDAGFEVVVVTRVRNHRDEIEEAGIRLIPFELSRRGMNPWQELGVIRRLLAIYRAERPHLVHHVAMKPAIYGTLAARMAGIPKVVNALAGLGWTYTSQSIRASLLRPLVNIGLRWLLPATTVFVENHDDAVLMRNLGVRHLEVYSVGVDVARYVPQPEPSGVPLIILPARLLWDKGVGEFVVAARLLKVRGVTARFALVGTSDPENPASVPSATLAEWAAEGAVECWGHCLNMLSVYSKAHVVCLPSYREGLPRSLLEAAACGRPIVTTDAPGCREVVQDGENGLLVPTRDAGALAMAMERLINDPDLRQRMGEKGRAKAVAEYSLEHVVTATLAAYRGLLACGH